MNQHSQTKHSPAEHSDRRSELATPPEVFFNRREFLRAVAAGAGLGAVACGSPGAHELAFAPALDRPEIFPAPRNSTFMIPEDVIQGPTPRVTAGSHNNFYEFIPGRAGEVWKLDRGLRGRALESRSDRCS